MAKLSAVNLERLDIALPIIGKLLADLKSRPLTGTDLDRMKLIEQAVTCLQVARLK